MCGREWSPASLLQVPHPHMFFYKNRWSSKFTCNHFTRGQRRQLHLFYFYFIIIINSLTYTLNVLIYLSSSFYTRFTSSAENNTRQLNGIWLLDGIRECNKRIKRVKEKKNYLNHCITHYHPVCYHFVTCNSILPLKKKLKIKAKRPRVMTIMMMMMKKKVDVYR